MFTKRQIHATRIEFLHNHASSFDASFFVVVPCNFPLGIASQITGEPKGSQ
jgi:hypothetical protein